MVRQMLDILTAGQDRLKVSENNKCGNKRREWALFALHFTGRQQGIKGCEGREAG